MKVDGKVVGAGWIGCVLVEDIVTQLRRTAGELLLLRHGPGGGQDPEAL